MSKKRTKQYLMLLMVIGLVSIAAGGSGTFASFSAETANNGNYFATGSLILNDNGGTNTCTSAAAANNINTGANNGCDTLFTLDKFTVPKATVASANLGDASITFSGLTAPIYKGDSLTISDANGSEPVTANSTAQVGDTSVTITGTLGAAYSSATLVDNSPTYFANLTLSNAGSLNASGISFTAGGTPCTDSYQEGETTLTSGVSAGSVASLSVDGTYGVARGFKAGQPVIVTDGTNTQTFTVGASDVASGATTITLAANQNSSYTFGIGSTVRGPHFGTSTLCDKLKLSIAETDSAFDHDSTNPALGCAYGSATGATTGLGCNYVTGGTAINGLPANTLTPLTLYATGGSGGNTNSNLAASGGTRYFVLAVHFNGASLGNSYQNRAAAGLDLTWHIDQA
jgi:hypothetical protein